MQRHTWIIFAAGLVLLAVALVAAGCGGGSDKARIRFVNATPDESGLDLLIDSKSVDTSIAYGSASSYSNISTGSHHFQVEPSGSTNILIDTTPSISSGDQTFVTLNYSFNIGSTLLIDDNSAPTSGNFKLRILNASPGMGAQDVYITTGTDITSISPTISSLGFGTASTYNSLAAGTYHVFFTDPGLKFINLDSGALTFSAGQVRTVLSLNSPAGGYMSTELSDAN